ncbi:uncharacterized protein LOC144462590 [Epinephelus lanceolatus]
MLLAEVGCVFLGFILCISGVSGRANRICALKGSSVDLPCSAERPTVSMQWYTVYKNASKNVLNEVPADGNRVMYNTSEESNFTLTIKDLKESDENLYCCRDDPELCWGNKTELRVADLQVQVIPAPEGPTVTLICNTSCPLTENLTVYIWYKNGELLYEDWSPWYQELVSSEEAVTYSCAIKGYEHLRAPEVSVDSVTSTCFSVTYAKGKMCSYKQTSVDQPCSITFPREMHIQKTLGKNSVSLTCNTSCPMADPQTAFRWYWKKDLYRHCESQHITFVHLSSGAFSCAVKGHEGLHSDRLCLMKDYWIVNYASRRLCALEDSSVNLISKYWRPSLQRRNKGHWHKVKRRDEEDAETLTEDADRVEFLAGLNNYHTLRINNVKKNDSAEYTFTLNHEWAHSDLPGVTLVVTGLKVTMTPSAVVTEGQRVTLTCSTSCPLPDNTTYMWFFNSQLLTLTENQNKHLVLNSVNSQHEGNYSCAIESPQNISSPVEILIVDPLTSIVVLNALKLTIVSLILPAVLLFHMVMRRRKTLSSATEQSDKARTGRADSLYERITFKTMNPAAPKEPAEHQEHTV